MEAARWATSYATMNERDLVKSGNSLIKKRQTVNILLGVEYENFNEIL
jgi:hypothetical protein